MVGLIYWTAWCGSARKGDLEAEKAGSNEWDLIFFLLGILEMRSLGGLRGRGTKVSADMHKETGKSVYFGNNDRKCAGAPELKSSVSMGKWWECWQIITILSILSVRPLVIK